MAHSHREVARPESVMRCFRLRTERENWTLLRQHLNNTVLERTDGFVKAISVWDFLETVYNSTSIAGASNLKELAAYK